MIKKLLVSTPFSNRVQSQADHKQPNVLVDNIESTTNFA